MNVIAINVVIIIIIVNDIVLVNITALTSNVFLSFENSQNTHVVKEKPPSTKVAWVRSVDLAFIRDLRSLTEFSTPRGFPFSLKTIISFNLACCRAFVLGYISSKL